VRPPGALRMGFVLVLVFLLFDSVRGAKYCNESVCLSVRSHISKTTRQYFTKFSVTCYLWPWLGSSSDDSAMCCVLPVLCMFLCNGGNRPESKTTVWFVKLARWRHRGEVCCLRLHLVFISVFLALLWMSGFIVLSLVSSVLIHHRLVWKDVPVRVEWDVKSLSVSI